MRIAVVNGPNLNLLGVRDPDVYGATTLRELDDLAVRWGRELGADVGTFQSNHEGDLIDHLHSLRGRVDGIVINPGALTHYSYALHDAIEAVGIPTVEVHISNIHARERWRHLSVVAPACDHTIFGRGIDGYRWAIRRLVNLAAGGGRVVPYGDGPDRIGELRLPDGPGPHRVAVVIHGGFWRDPWTRDTMDAAALALTGAGWATWNIEYHRIGEGGGWPVTFLDVAAAVDRLATLDAPIDPTQVVVVGHSAGGHLALWAAARHRLPAGVPGADPAVRPVAAVGLAPVADLTMAHRLGLGDGAVEDLLRRTPETGRDRYDVADPARLLPLGVPVGIVHGADDDVVPVSVSAAFAEAATAAGDAVDLIVVDAVGHMDLIEPSSGAWPSVVRSLDLSLRRRA